MKKNQTLKICLLVFVFLFAFSIGTQYVRSQIEYERELENNPLSQYLRENYGVNSIEEYRAKLEQEAWLNYTNSIKQQLSDEEFPVDWKQKMLETNQYGTSTYQPLPIQTQTYPWWINLANTNPFVELSIFSMSGLSFIAMLMIPKFGKKLLQKKWLVGIVIVAFVFYAGFMVGKTVAQTTFPPNLYFDSLPSTASYVIQTDGTYVWATRADGKIAFGGANNAGGVSGTDASAVIQSAINALTEGKIYIKEGDYNLTSSLLIDGKGISIEGVPVKTRFLGTVDPLLKIKNLNVPTTTRVSFKGLMFEGKSGGTNQLLVVEDSSRLLFEDITTKHGGSGVVLVGAINNVFLNLFVEGASKTFQEPIVGGGIWIKGSTNSYSNTNLFLGGEVTCCAGDGVVAEFGSKNTFINMVFEANNVGFRIYSGCSRNVIESCWFEANTLCGVDVYSSTVTEGVRIYDSLFSVPSGGKGIIVRGNDRLISGCFFTGQGSPYLEIKTTGVTDPKSILIEKNTGLTSAKISDAVGAKYKDNVGYVTENSGTATFNGDGTTKTFTIAHGLAGTPKSWHVEAGSNDAKGDKYITADATNLTVTFATAPPAGTNNVVLVWSAEM